MVEMLCAKYSSLPVGAGFTTKDKIVYSQNFNGAGIAIHDADYSDAASFKNSVDGVMLYYKLAEEIATDITSLMSWDGSI